MFKPSERRHPRVSVPPTGGHARVNTKTTYISRDGLDKLRLELEEMVNVRRPEIAQRIHDAKEHGDLSENAEYEDAKNEQAFVEGRIQTLEGMIKSAQLIDEHTSTDHVQDDGAAQAADVDRARRGLGVVDDLRTLNACGELVRPIHARFPFSEASSGDANAPVR